MGGHQSEDNKINQSERKASIVIQDECLQHRFIRSRDSSSIVERPERIRAVKVGVAAAIARLEEIQDTHGGISPTPAKVTQATSDPDDLIAALGRMNLAADPAQPRIPSLSILKSHATVNLLDDPATKFIHGDVDGDVYLQNLKNWAKESQDNILKNGSEIPSNLPQLDLYLSPGSIDAIQGAVGAVCEAVDTVINSTRQHIDVKDHAHRVFVAIRPPGHHCGEDTPCGFCFVNNVAVGAAHAHLKHGIRRILIFDIDLHHGNGTQSIIWQINEETYRQTLESEYAPSDTSPKTGPQIYYGSIHDILSFPCEDGNMQCVQAASTCLHGPHGQHIENIHIQAYESNDQFWELYRTQYTKIFTRAEEFLDKTGGPGDDVLVLLSSGFDACEHEGGSMSRHKRNVPASFYYRFTRDACAFADRYAQGRIVSVLEGGYSDRALISGAMAHMCGLVDIQTPGAVVDEEWWSAENLDKLEKATKKRKGGRQSAANSPEPWLDRALSVFTTLEAGASQNMTPSSSRNTFIPPTSMTLRDRRKPSSKLAETQSSATSSSGSPTLPQSKRGDKDGSEKTNNLQLPPSTSSSSSDITDSSSDVAPNSTGLPISAVEEVIVPAKKLPRVILKVGPPPSMS
ncbi:hypothetical protein SERLA73DRAFT_171749 [Serpula lacrymans var. lacrymans S7.3]|uniref:Histone deacetylase domain-containing protein n=2 Tax=Serpula lacrymans var. lacrymans TaxID=341189 RepID=F8QCJ5_SERL3|nr:hypothetical protein SERLA73DRAFT_171749 [Serpula lacrymans var. lacrymans S7.3]